MGQIFNYKEKNYVVKKISMGEGRTPPPPSGVHSKYQWNIFPVQNLTNVNLNLNLLPTPNFESRKNHSKQLTNKHFFSDCPSMEVKQHFFLHLKKY